MIDYRHLDANDIEPLFEFGFGLSYTQFNMSSRLAVHANSGLSPHADKSKGVAPCGMKDLWAPVAKVNVEITNVGDWAGTAVPQLYVSLPTGKTPKGTPVRSLKGFEKVYLKPGQTRKVRFELKERDLSFWDEERKQWVIPESTFIFAAGFSLGTSGLKRRPVSSDGSASASLQRIQCRSAFCSSTIQLVMLSSHNKAFPRVRLFNFTTPPHGLFHSSGLLLFKHLLQC